MYMYTCMYENFLVNQRVSGCDSADLSEGARRVDDTLREAWSVDVISHVCLGKLVHHDEHQQSF